jgi:uncharacterized protein YneF (UPF0154 family)
VGKPGPKLPPIPPELMTPADRNRAKAMRTARRSFARGNCQANTVVNEAQIRFLMEQWGVKTKADMVRAALGYLARQTRAGLLSFETDKD